MPLCVHPSSCSQISPTYYFLNLFSVHGIKRAIIHPDFDSHTDPHYVADIALLLVSVSISNQVFGIKKKYFILLERSKRFYECIHAQKN